MYGVSEMDTGGWLDIGSFPAAIDGEDGTAEGDPGGFDEMTGFPGDWNGSRIFTNAATACTGPLCCA